MLSGSFAGAFSVHSIEPVKIDSALGLNQFTGRLSTAKVSGFSLISRVAGYC